MNPIKKHIRKKILSTLFITLIFASFLAVNMTSTSAAPALTLKWIKNIGPYAKTYIGPLAADINNDGRLDIIVTGGSIDGGTDGTITALDGPTGNIIWQVSPGGIGMHSPAEIADINNDGVLEVIVSGFNPVVLRGTDGSVLWRNTAVSSDNNFSPVYDIDGDGYYEIFVSSGNGPTFGYDYIRVLNHEGKILAQNPTSWHPCWGGMTIGDPASNGTFILYQGDRDIYYNPAEDPYKYGGWGVRALDPRTLTPLWNDSSIRCSSHTPMLADVDKDGILDVVVAHQAGGFAVYNAFTGAVLTTGGVYRKSLSLGITSHSQPTIYDIDGDGNLEIITCRQSNITIWDLYRWQRDVTLPLVAWEPPMVGDVNGDGKTDIIGVNGTHILIYDVFPDGTYTLLETVGPLNSISAHTLLADVDNDGFMELILTSYAADQGRVYCFDTTAPKPNPHPRTNCQFYSERHCGAAEYVPPPGPKAPQITNPTPADGATNVQTTLTQLTFRLTDYQRDPISYSVTTNPNIGSASGINVPNGVITVPISGLAYSTTYTWTVTATDGTNINTKTFAFTTSDLPPWYSTYWQYRRTITIDRTKVSGDQTNFPVLIDLTDPTLITKAQADGDDFLFADANQNKLNHEIELYDSTTGRLVAWVNVPLLSSTVDTVLYLYYGNPSCGSQQNPTAVWNSSHKLVLHLDEKTGTHYDSTTNANNGTPYNGVLQGVTSKIDGGDTFDGTNDYIEVAHSDTLAGYTDAATFSFWIRIEDTARRQAILNKYNTVTNQRGWFIEYNPVDRPTRPFGFYASRDGTNYNEWYASFVPSAGVWYYVVVVWEANAVPRFYVNGVQVATVGTATIPSIYNNVGVPLHIARSTYNTARYLKGSLDEIRISNPARSAGYILTCYNNQLNPAAFYTISPEEGLPAEPLVKNPSPANDATNVPVTITELSFDIQDYQQDLMNVTVTTSPNIGVVSLKDVSNGRYAVSVSGLAYSTTYTWTVTATDGTYTTIKTYCFTTELAPAADDIIFNSNFDMGNLINVTYVEGRPGYRHYLAATRYTIGVDPAHTEYTARTNNDKHWWFYFSMENVAGKTIAVSIVNGTDADWSTSDTNGNRWPEIEPVYSYDNINWYRVPLSGVTYDRTAKRFTINITVPAGITKVWLAPLPPYNIARRDALFAEFEGNPYLTVTSLGTTPGGQELKVATITDPAYSAEGKFKSYVIAQQHPGEVPGSWNAEGLIRFLLSDDPTAAAIRRSYIFRIIPIVNVDGVYQGICRYTPVRNGYQYDLNRWWNIPPSNDAPFEVRVIYQDIQAFKPHSFNDFHSTINTEQLSPKEALTYRYSTVTTEYTNFMDKIKAGGWPETVRAASTLAGGAFQNVLSRLGVAFSLSWENPHDELSTNPGVKLTTNDWMNWGKAWAIGNYLYFGDAKATLKVTTNGNGLVTKDPDYANYTYGTSVQLTATAAEGYIFSRWEGDLTGNLNPATIIMTGNKTINAVFVEKTYRLNINIDGSGLVIRNNTGPYHYGDVVELTAVPSPDWDFAGWSGDITSTDNPVIITITKDTEVTARFTGQYALTINVIGAGTVVKSPNKPFYKYGEPVELTAVADPGWTFSGWSGDLSGNENPVTITVTSEKTITATFTANNWWNSNWKYRRTITIDRTKVAADQTNFPVLIDITDVGLTSKAQPDGDDFVFTTANNVKLNHEIESYDSTTGRLVAWVNVPYLSSTVDTVLYLYYGNSACGNQQNPSAVWDSSYKLVLHLNEQAGIHSDSSVYSNNGAPVNGVLQGVPSKIDGGDTFDGVNDYIEIAHSNTLTGYTTAFSVGFWVRLQDTSRRQTIINKYDTTGNQRGWFVEYDPTVRPTRPFAFFASNDGINYREWYASFVPSAGVWYYVVVVWEANAVPRFYVNGVQVATVGTATIPSIYNNPNTPLFIGRCPYNTARYFSGSLDEITISNPARSASWIQTSYNNQLNPAAFYDISGEETFAEYYTLTIYKVGQGTVSADPQKQYYKSGDTVTLTATPESGYTFQNWSGDLTGTNNPATIVVTRNMAVTAHFIIKQYTITSSISGEGGTISPSGLVAVSHGADQTFTITPDEGYHILDVLVDGESQGAIATYTFTNVNADHTITATFARNEYTLTVQFSPEGSGTVALNNTGPYYHGDVVELTAEPNSGWYFLEWAGDLSGSQNPASIIMDGDKTITATFTQQQQQQYTLTITIVGGGSVEANPSKTQYNAGEEVMLTATADAGYSFAGWSGDIISTDNPLTLIMGSSKSLTATFTQDQYTLTVNIDGQGSVTLNPDQTTYTYNAAVELTATAAAGWEFSHWSGALTGSESSATLIITGDAVVTAHFTQIPQSQHTLVINIVGNGVVTKTPDQTTYADGATVELAATAASGWTFSHWSGDAAGTSNPITITMDGDKTVTAYFAQMLLTDSTFDASSSSEVLRDNSEGQDWYESRGAFSNGNPALLTLDTNDIGGNNGKKAALKNYGIADATSNAYLTQELSTTYSGIYPLSFELSFDIYIDKIENNGDFDRTGHIYIGDDSNTANAPTGAAYERFVLLAFYDPTPGDSGTDLELRARTLNTDAQSWSNTALWEQVATGLSYDTWYTIKIVINTASGTYDVYINGVLARAGISKMNDYPASNPIKYVTFSADSDGRGDFYIDNVKATLIESYNGVHFAGAGAGIAGTGSTLQPSYPSGLQTGDLILLQVTVRDTTNIPTTPTGFTLLYGPNSTGTGRQWIYYKISDGTETGTITITIAGSAVKVARMYAFRNTATTDFAESAAFTSGLGTTISAPSSVTTSGNNQLVVAFVFVTYNNAVSSFTGETGGDWQETIPEYTTTSGSRGCIQLQTAMMFSAGTITGGSCTMTSSQAWGVLAFAIKPAI